MPANAGDVRDMGLITGSGRSPRGGNGNLLQYSCLENPMDRVTWRDTIHSITKSQTWLKWLSTYSLHLIKKTPEIIKEIDQVMLGRDMNPKDKKGATSYIWRSWKAARGDDIWVETWVEKGSEPCKDLGKILPGRGNSHAKVLSQKHVFCVRETAGFRPWELHVWRVRSENGKRTSYVLIYTRKWNF